MNIFTHYIHRTYRSELLKAEENGFNRSRKLSKIELNKALEEQRDLFELQLISKDNEIENLEKTIDYMERQANETNKKVRHAKEVFLEAKKIITRAEIAYRRHIEADGRVMVDFRDIRLDAEKFEKKLIGE